MTSSPSYLDIVRARPAFRRMWLAALTSQCGDWMTLLALYSRMLHQTGGVAATGAMVALRMLPSALVAPWAGVWADRLPRKFMLITCDLLRAGIVLGFIWADTPERLVWVYVLTFAQHALGAVFDPTEQAAIASVVAPSEIVAAHTLHALTWSAMLSVGSILGGLVVSHAGVDAAFAINSATYLVSAYFIARADIPFAPTTSTGSGWNDLRAAVRRIEIQPSLRQSLLGKTGWAISGGGALVMYAVLGEREFRLGGHGAAGIGVLLATRGVGALLGPLLSRRIGGDGEGWLRKAVGFAYVWTATFYVAFALAPSLVWAALALLFAHLAISTQWVFTNSLIARGVEDSMRGRMFALDGMVAGLAMGVSSFGAGLAVDATPLSPREVMGCIAALQLASFFAWRALYAPSTGPSSSNAGGAEPSIARNS